MSAKQALDSTSDRDGEERARTLRSVIDSNRFMTLATADEHGTPWASPVWFASPDCRRFLWVSLPTTRHSRNLGSRPEVAIVIYDSRTTPAERQAVYVEATAREVTGDDVDEGIEIFSNESVSQGLAAWDRETVTPPGRYRLYEATARARFVLADGPDERLPVPTP
jgi:nitroimidazol reductase NimA-like FMN-containing flavoprotein (pyridoxamine 5'-phosphate oxidase superfamily)